MNHSSARNYVLRVMRKFAKAFSDNYDLDLTEEQIDEVAKSPTFQYMIAEKLQVIEQARRNKEKSQNVNRKNLSQ
jgi:hypothetical protein